MRPQLPSRSNESAGIYNTITSFSAQAKEAWIFLREHVPSLFTADAAWLRFFPLTMTSYWRPLPSLRITGGADKFLPTSSATWLILRISTAASPV